MTRTNCRHAAAIALLAKLLLLPFSVGLACEPLGRPADTYLASADGRFHVPPGASPDELVIALADCLDDPDPVARDEVAYMGIAKLLRAGSVDADTVRTLKALLLTRLTKDDPSGDGFTQPFAALALAEVARVDRVEPLFSDAERSELVAAATRYVIGVRDYRGFEEEAGWRHGVAHGADLLLQLVLNSALDDAHVRPIVEAALSQVRAANGHAYVFGEGQRLARPVLYAARRDLISAAEWQALFAPLAAAPGDSWNAAFSSTDDLAVLHNTRQFLLSVYSSVAESDDAVYAGIRDASRNALTALP